MIIREFILTDAQKVNGTRILTAPINTRSVANDTISGNIGASLNCVEAINDTARAVILEISEYGGVYTLAPYSRMTIDIPANPNRRYRVFTSP